MGKECNCPTSFFRFPLCIGCEVLRKGKAVAVTSSREVPVASSPACSDPVAESMEKKSSRCFSCFSCCSAGTLSSSDAEHQTPRSSHAHGSLTIHGLSAPSSSEPNLSLVAVPDNNVLEGTSFESSNANLQAVLASSSSSGLPAAGAFSSQPSPSRTDVDKVLEGGFSESSNAAVSHDDELQGVPLVSSSGVTLSSPDSEHQAPPSSHADGSLTIHALSASSSSQPNPSPVADNNVLEGNSFESSNTNLQAVPASSSSSGPSAAGAFSSQPNSSRTAADMVLEGGSSESLKSVVSQHDELQAVPLASSSGEALSCPDAEHQTTLSSHTHGSLTIHALSAPSSSQTNPSPVADNNVLEGSSLESSNTTLQAVPASSCSSVPSAEGGSSESLNAAISHRNELQAVPLASSSGVTEPDLDNLIKQISELLKAIKEKKSHKKTKKTPKTPWPSVSPDSKGLLKLKDLLLEGINCITALKPSQEQINAFMKDIFNGIGQVHWALAGLLVVSYVLERLEDVSKYDDQCQSLLHKMFTLAVHIKCIKERTKLGKAMEDSLRKGTKLIVKASLICGTRIDRSKFSKFFTTSVDNNELLKFEEKLQRTYTGYHNQMGLLLYDATTEVQEVLTELKEVLPQVKEVLTDVMEVKEMLTKVKEVLTEVEEVLHKAVLPKPRPGPREWEYPDHAVGIDEQLERVIEHLQSESGGNAYAVILHGVGGMGKTTLADAVIARHAQLNIEGCTYSKVILAKDETPNILELQKNILKDLVRGTKKQETIEQEIPYLTIFEDGQRKIGSILQEQEAFIYIDNVLKKEWLEQLLPNRRILEKAKKLRVLITARDVDVLRGLKMKNYDIHKMECLPFTQSLNLLHDIDGQIDANQQQHIAELCGGNPLLLHLAAAFIDSEREDKQKAYNIVMEDSEKWSGDTFRDIDKCIFAYDHLPDECKDPFLDVCSFFKGWEWETVETIVGESALSMLQKRALVSKDKNMTLNVQDVILGIGKLKAKETRFEFTNKTAIDDFLEKDMADIEKVQGLWLSDRLCNIPATKLNSMSKSLRIFAHKIMEGKCEKRFEKLLFYKGEIANFPFKWSGLKALRFLNYQPEDLNLLKEIPSNLKHLELDGSRCSNVSKISSSDIQQLPNLQVLRLINFKKLKSLPRKWGANVINSLKELTLSGCESIKELTESISQLKKLKILKLDNCCELERLPEDFGTLTSLEVLDFSRCSIKELPKSISELQCLKILILTESDIRSLPPLSSLEELQLSGCVNLEALPKSLIIALDSKSRRLLTVFQQKGVLKDDDNDADDYESNTGDRSKQE